MKIGDTVTIGGEKFQIRKEYSDGFLAVDEFLTTFKRIAKLKRVK